MPRSMPTRQTRRSGPGTACPTGLLTSPATRWWWRWTRWASTARSIFPPFRCIPRSRHDPKILWVDDAKIVGDRIAEIGPVAGNFFAQETERRIGELGARCVGFVVRDVSVHDAP